MPSLNEIVSLTISRQTQSVTAEGFGLMMVLGLHKRFTGRYKVYASLAEVATDFSSDTAEYKAANSAFDQDISVTQIAIGRQDSDVVTLTPTVQNSKLYSVTINSSVFTYTSDSSATAAEIVTGLKSAITGGSEPVTPSGSTTLIITPNVSGVPYVLKYSANLTPVYTPTESLTAALTAIAKVNNDWYGLAAYTHVTADITEIAAYAQANKKLYGTSSSAAVMYSDPSSDTTSAAILLQEAAYDRTWIMYSSQADVTYPECGLFGGELARDPGAATWSFKTIVGTTVDNLDTTQQANLEAKNAITYTTVSGTNMTWKGRTSQGTPIDIIRDLDWLGARIMERIFGRLVNLPKIAYTDNGIAIVEAEVRGQAQKAVEANVLANSPAPEVIAPKAADVSSTDRSNRLLPNVKLNAQIAGAIESVNVSLNIVV